MPVLAINGHDRRNALYDNAIYGPITTESIAKFCKDYVNHRTRTIVRKEKISEEDMPTLMPMQSSSKLPSAVSASATSSLPPPLPPPPPVVSVPDVVGVSLTLTPSTDLRYHMSNLCPNNFSALALALGRDVLLLIHDDGHKSKALAVQYRVVSERFHDLLGVTSSLAVTRIDLSSSSSSECWSGSVASLSTSLLPNIDLSVLPVVLLLPAWDKGKVGEEPYLYYSGVGKAQAMMKWVHDNVGVTFKMQELPHLNDEEKVRYKVQIEERESGIRMRKEREKQQQQQEEQEQEQHEIEASRTNHDREERVVEL